MRLLLRLSVLAGLLYSLLLPAGAGAHFRQHYPAASFLKAEQVYHVTKDRRGFLWFATDNGVTRYDGKNVQHFNTLQGLPDNTVFNIYEDRSGRTWLFTYNGRYCFIKDGQVHHAGNDTFLRRLPRSNSYINYIAEQDSAGMYFGFFSGDILQVNGHNTHWLYRNPAKDYVCIIKAGKKDVLAYFRDGYIRITGGKAGPRQVTPSRNIFSNGDYQVSVEAGGIKIYRSGQLAGSIMDERLSITSVIHAFCSDAGLLFCSTSHGLEIVDIKKLSRQLLFAGIKITSCTADLAGNYWVTTYDNGVYMLHHELDAIRKLPVPGEIQKVWAQDGTVYFTAGKKLYSLAGSLAPIGIKLVTAPFEAYHNLLHACEQHCFYRNSWKNTIQERNNHIPDLMGGWAKKIYRWETQHLFAYGSVATAFLAKRGGVWKASGQRTFPEKIKAAAQDPVSGEVFFVSGTELFQCDFRRHISRRILHDSILLNVRDIYAFDTNIIVTTHTPFIYRICMKDGTPVSTILKMPFIINEMAFIRAGRYLVWADGEYYIASAGQNACTFRRLVYPFSSSGYERIYPYKEQFIVKTSDGLYVCPAALINKTHVAPRLLFNGLTVNGSYYRDTSITVRSGHRLDIRITPGILSFGSNDRTIQYRIIDERVSPWYSTTSEDINLMLERPGDYIIEIGQGMQQGSIAPIRIHINALPPFYRTLAFYLLVGLLIILLVVLIVSRLLKKRRQRFERELNYLRLEHRSINALLNPHFIFNAINNIQNLILHSRQEEATEYLATLSLLIRQNIENLQYTLISMGNERVLLENYITLQNLRFGNNIVLQIDDLTGSCGDIWLPPLLLHTFVENAIVHGYKDRKKTFYITITIEPALHDYIVITITDNGVGLQSPARNVFDKGKSSMGIAFNRKRLKRVSDYYKVDQSITLNDRALTGCQGAEVVIVLYARLHQLLQTGMPVH